MSETKDAPAFPVVASHTVYTHGMTLRDWFAGQALAGLCANSGGPVQAVSTTGWGFINCNMGDVAGVAYDLADAMLAARSRHD